MKNYQTCDRVSVVALSVGVFLGLMAFLPGGLIPSPVLKGYLVLTCMFVAFVAWLIGRLMEGAFHIPWTAILGSAGAVLFTMFVSALFSKTPYLSFLGEGFEAGTFAVFSSMLLGLFLSSVLFTSRERVSNFFKVFFGLYILLGLFQIVHIIFPEATALGIFGSRVDSPTGSWSDFAFISGAVLVGSMLMLQLTKQGKRSKILLGAALVMGLFFVVLANIITVWILVGLSSIIVLIYTLIMHRTSEKRYFPFLAFFLSLLGLLFVLANSLLGGFLAGLLNAGYYEVHPTLAATTQTALESVQHHPIVGAGPNRFLREWLMYRPVSANFSMLWDVPFVTGSSFFLTLAILGGSLGIIAVLVFLFAFFYEGGRKLFSADGTYEHIGSHLPIFGIFMLTLYFVLALIIASPGLPVIVTGLVMIGILVGTLVTAGRIRMRNIHFLRDQRASFFSILLIVALLLISAAGVYGATQRFAAIVYYERGVQAVTRGDIDLGNARLGQAIALSNLPTFHRTRILFAQRALQETASLPPNAASSDSVKAALQSAISTGNEAARSAIAIDPNDPANYIALGDMLRLIAPLKVEGLEKAGEEAYLKAIELVPRYPKPYLSLAEFYFNIGDNTRAREYVEKAVAEKSNYTAAYFLLAQIEIAAGNTNTAIARIQEATIVDPTNPDAFFELGILRYNTGDYNNAIAAFRRTVSLNSNYLNAWFYLALADQKVGNMAEANEILQILHERFPDNQNVTNALNLKSGDTTVAPEQSSITPSPTTTKTEKSKKLPLPQTTPTKTN